jgi:phosphohistidine phosphatase
MTEDPQGRMLIILRHTKSDWNSEAENDFDRPLNKRGRKDAPRMGRWLLKHKLLPDHVLGSPARRAEQTLLAVAKELEVKKKRIHWEPRIYEAAVGRLLDVLGEVPAQARRVLLVGHNPGLEELVAYLCRTGSLPDPPVGFLKTGACAVLQMPEDWHKLSQGCAELSQLVRPKELRDD